jgi:MFS transporter, DHA1 family, multidrug resistance protein
VLAASTDHPEYRRRQAWFDLSVGSRSRISTALRRADRATDRGEASSAGQRLRLYLVLAALTILGPFAIDMYLPGLPALARDLRASESTSQLTLTACLVGLALGQLIAGPLSDALGRRRPLMIGLIGYVLTSLLCALAVSIEMLVAFRLLQGLAGGVGVVVATAVVRDRYTGAAAARFFSLLMLAIMISPLFAPSIGGELLHVTTWHGIFVALAVVGLLVLAAAWFGLPETLPSERRRPGGVRDAVASMRRLITEREFLSFAVPACLMNGALFAYIAGSSFVFQQIYGVSPQTYGYLFAMNGAALVISSQVNRLLVGRLSPYQLMRFGLIASAVAGVALLAVALAGGHPLVALMVPLVAIIASFGLVAPNSSALALSAHGDEAGAGSALLGALRFASGAVVAPLVGVGGAGTATPMVAIIVVLGLAALVSFVALGPRRAEQEADARSDEPAAA